MKKIGSLLLALTMALCLSTSVFADTELYSGGGKMTVYPGVEKQIEFTGTFSGPFFVAFSDQGQVIWNGLETGVKDFSFNLEPIDWVLEKHPGVQFINFPPTPDFVETATVQLTIPVNDGLNPSLYMINEAGEIVGVPDVEVVGGDNKKFEFKANELAETYIISTVSLNYETAPSIEDTTIPEPVEEPELDTEEPVVDEPVVDEPVVDEPVVEEPTEPAPQTGVQDAPYMMIALAGCVGVALVALTKKKD